MYMTWSHDHILYNLLWKAWWHCWRTMKSVRREMCWLLSKLVFWWVHYFSNCRKFQVIYFAVLNLFIFALFFLPQKLFGMEMAEFKVQIKCMWNSETGEFENCAGEEDPMQDIEEEEGDDDVEWNICKSWSLYTSFCVQSFCQEGLVNVRTIHSDCLFSPRSLFIPFTSVCFFKNFCPSPRILALDWIVLQKTGDWSQGTKWGLTCYPVDAARFVNLMTKSFVLKLFAFLPKTMC